MKSAAFQSLGPFISTFADPKRTGLLYNDNGGVVEDVKDHESSGSNDSGCSVETVDSVESGEEFKECDTHSLPSYVNSLTINEFARTQSTTTSSAAKPTFEATTQHVPEAVAETNEFDTFQFWRVPIPDIDVDDIADQVTTPIVTQSETVVLATRPTLAAATATASNESVVNGSHSHDALQELSNVQPHDSQPPHIESGDQSDSDAKKESSDGLPPYDDVQSKKTSVYVEGGDGDKDGDTFESSGFEPTVPFFGSSSNLIVPTYGEAVLNHSSSSTANISLNLHNCVAQYRKVPLRQDIIPNDLLEHYLSMTNPINYQTVDQDLTHHCAYALPAVALTLGRKYWPCLKETYELLALDMQWKVRWTLATSLHQMALILGPEYTSQDLLPVFLSFMKDLDEVRYGILQNLAAILRLLNRPEQLGILPKLSEFLKLDNNRNWRIRYTLCEQIIEIAPIYDAPHIKEHLFPIAFKLLQDKVCEVRLGAISLLSTLLQRFFSNDFNEATSSTDLEALEQMTGELVAEVNTFLRSPKWMMRQVYVLLCEQLIVDQSLPNDIFYKHFMSNLLSLSGDNVPNVRLALSRCLSRTLPTSGEWRAKWRSLDVTNRGFPSTDILRAKQSEAISTLNLLKSDTDRDVRRFANGVVDSNGVYIVGEVADEEHAGGRNVDANENEHNHSNSNGHSND